MKPKNASFVLIMSRNKILLFHRDDIPTIPNPDCWQLVGGGIEEGETPEQALIREVKEEVCFDLKNFEYVTKFMGERGEVVWLYITFVEKSDEDKFVHGEGEGQEIGWFTINEALKIKTTPRINLLLGKYLNLIEEMMRTRKVVDIKNITFYTTGRPNKL